MGCLRGKKVLLRPIVRNDLEKLNIWKNDENVYKYLGGGFQPTSIDIQNKWMEALMDTTGNNKRFIIENTNSEAVGMIGLYSINWVHRSSELGIFVGDMEQQGKGYASEAYYLLEEYVRKYINLHKIKAYVVKDNEKAVSMYKKLHFRSAGCLVEERFIDGKYCDVLIMEKIYKSEC